MINYRTTCFFERSDWKMEVCLRCTARIPNSLFRANDGDYFANLKIKVFYVEREDIFLFY